MGNITYNLYPELEIFDKNFLSTADSHEIYYEVCGNPMGQPVVFCHGGPGSGCSPTQRRFFDPDFYRIVLIDQRGCGPVSYTHLDVYKRQSQGSVFRSGVLYAI